MKATDQVYFDIEKAIRVGMLLPGDPISEAEYMERYQVSRTPVREALLKLEAQDMLTSLPRGGMVVAKMDVQQLISMWELLAELEAISVRLACERMSTEERLALAQVHADAAVVVEKNDMENWRRVNLAFHEMLYVGSRNSYLKQEILRMRSRTGAYRRHAFDAFGRLKVSYAQHQEIVDAIAAHDAAKAGIVMIRHLQPAQGVNGMTNLIVNLPKALLG